jgi:tRNA threonylcarbamoyladenosine biosynthesis protein TsaE
MHTITTPEEMLQFWIDLAKEHKILLLHGELWAGKTLLTKGFAQGLWLNQHHVQSPTYAYLNVYDSKLLHIDMYRIKEYSELVEKWIIDQINEFEYIVIERPKFIDKLPIKNSSVINIEKNSETERLITIKKGE